MFTKNNTKPNLLKKIYIDIYKTFSFIKKNILCILSLGIIVYITKNNNKIRTRDKIKTRQVGVFPSSSIKFFIC